MVIRRARLRFWLVALDVAHQLDSTARALHSRTWQLYLWTVARASAAEDWGPPVERDDGDKPW